MNNKILLSLSLGMCSASLQAAMVWQPAPLEAKKSASAHMGHGSSRGGTPFLLTDGEGAEAEMWLPTRVRRPLAVGANGQVSVKGSGVSSYHLLLAKKTTSSGEDVAMRYVSQHGKPSGESPASIVNLSKVKLNLNPAPLTREHQRYTSQKAFNFVVSFDGKPLSSHAVLLTTSNGSSVEEISGPQGNVSFVLPDDFTNVEQGRGNNRPAEFVVAVNYKDADKNYHTTLSAPYFVSPSHWQSMTGGLVAMFAGVMTGLVVLRRSTSSSNASGRV